MNATLIFNLNLSWGIIQTILGAWLTFFLRDKRIDWDVTPCAITVYLTGKRQFGVSLGVFIFVPASEIHYQSERIRKHESGHCPQSAGLGPLYLLVAGIPSVARVLYSRWMVKRKRWTEVYAEKWYVSGYPERWADRLGGVI